MCPQKKLSPGPSTAASWHARGKKRLPALRRLRCAACAAPLRRCTAALLHPMLLAPPHTPLVLQSSFAFCCITFLVASHMMAPLAAKRAAQQQKKSLPAKDRAAPAKPCAQWAHGLLLCCALSNWDEKRKKLLQGAEAQMHDATQWACFDGSRAGRRGLLLLPRITQSRAKHNAYKLFLVCRTRARDERRLAPRSKPWVRGGRAGLGATLVHAPPVPRP